MGRLNRRRPLWGLVICALVVLLSIEAASAVRPSTAKEGLLLEAHLSPRSDARSHRRVLQRSLSSVKNPQAQREVTRGSAELDESTALLTPPPHPPPLPPPKTRKSAIFNKPVSHEADRRTMLAIRSELDSESNPRWRLQDMWNLDVDPCRWHDVYCNSDGRVMQLSLSYVSDFPKSTANLTSLSMFFLSDLYVDRLPDDLFRSMKNLTKLQIARSPGLSRLPPSISAVRLEEAFLNYNAFSEFPGEICSPQLQTLMMVGQAVSELKFSRSQDLAKCTGLRSLSLLQTPLQSLPDVFGNMTALESFSVSRTGLTTIPSSLGQAKKLQFLGASHNRLRSLPNFYWPELDRLILSHNKISKLPDGLSKSESLRHLEVQHNRLTEIPDLSKMKRLTRTFFSDNRLKEVPSVVVHGNHRMTSLEFSLENNQITSIPEDLWSRFRIRDDIDSAFGFTINLRNNKISHVPEGIWLGRHAAQVARLRLSRNTIKVFPKGLNKSSSLIHLDLRDNEIETISNEVSAYPKLKILDITNNRVAEIGVMMPESLRYLLASRNSIKRVLPGVLSEPTNLSGVDLSQNELKEIDELMNMRAQNLKTLDVSMNAIEYLPAGFIEKIFSSRSSERKLDISFNKIFNIFQPGSSSHQNVPRLADVDILKLDSSALFDAQKYNGSSTSDAAGRANAIYREIVGESSTYPLEWIDYGRTKNGAELCLARRLSNHINGASLEVVSCKCRTGYFRRGHICQNCIESATCKDDMVICFQGFHLVWQGDMPACQKCPDGGYCKDNVILALPGFWKPEEAPRVYECMRGESCLGGSGGTNLTCAEGHYGPLCGICEKHYYRGVGGACTKCPDLVMSLSYVIFTAIGAGVVVFIAWALGEREDMLKAVLLGKGNVNVLEGGSQNMMNGEEAQQAAGEVLSYLRLAVGFIQTLNLFPETFDVEWDAAIELFVSLFSWVQLDLFSASSVSCLWQHYSPYEESRFYTYCEALAVGAGGLLLISSCLWVGPVVVACIRSIVKPVAGISIKYSFRVVQTVTLIILLMCYIPLSYKAVMYFKCMTFDEGETWWMREDLGVQCHKARWTTFIPVAVLILVFYTIGFPALLVAYLSPSAFIRRHDLSLTCLGSLGQRPVIAGLVKIWDDVGAQVRKIFSTGYRRKYAYWEAVELTRKVTITLLVSMVAGSAELQVTIALIISTLAFVLHIMVKPYCTANMNIFHGIHLLLVMLTLQSGLLRAIKVRPSSAHFVCGFVVFLNIVFVVVTIVKVLAVTVPKVGTVLRTLKLVR